MSETEYRVQSSEYRVQWYWWISPEPVYAVNHIHIYIFIYYINTISYISYFIRKYYNASEQDLRCAEIFASVESS